MNTPPSKSTYDALEMTSSLVAMGLAHGALSGAWDKQYSRRCAPACISSPEVSGVSKWIFYNSFAVCDFTTETNRHVCWALERARVS